MRIVLSSILRIFYVNYADINTLVADHKLSLRGFNILHVADVLLASSGCLFNNCVRMLFVMSADLIIFLADYIWSDRGFIFLHVADVILASSGC